MRSKGISGASHDRSAQGCNPQAMRLAKKKPRNNMWDLRPESAILGKGKIVHRNLRIPGRKLLEDTQPPTERASGDFLKIYIYTHIYNLKKIY